MNERIYTQPHQTHTIFGTRNSSLANTKIYMLLYRYCFVLLCISKYKPPRAYIRRGDLTEGFLRYEFKGALIFGGSDFPNFTVLVGKSVS